jgi:hypothetical protein
MNRNRLLFKSVRQELTGVEVVTTVLDENNAKEVVEKVLNAFSLAGELKTSVRGATHIHIGFPNYYDWVYNFFVLSVYLESFFFNIGGMGSGFRGQFNESIYCRPLTSPHCFSWNRGFFKLFDYEKVLESKPSEDVFWKLFLHRLGLAASKYPPGRYLYVNFMSLIMHGTLELRVLNNTLNPEYLNAVVDLFRNVCQLSVYIPQRNLEYLKSSLNDSNHNKLEIIADLISNYNLLGLLKQPSINTLHTLLEKTPNYIPNDNILSHVSDKTTIGGDVFMTEEITKYRKFIRGKPSPSGFLDTHQGNIYEFDRLERNRILCAN